ncbi:MAG: hypothetical protein PQJ50_16070 [Spirochaetales bacterium]|nr:hypothetical protein [Spirochaetales bacterium]
MDPGDLIYTLLTLVMLVVFIMSPVIRKFFKSVGREDDERPTEDRMYESVDSRRVVERSVESIQSIEEFPQEAEPETVSLHKLTADREPATPVERIDRLSPLKRAVIWKEILDKPAGFDF